MYSGAMRVLQPLQAATNKVAALTVPQGQKTVFSEDIICYLKKFFNGAIVGGIGSFILFSDSGYKEGIMSIPIYLAIGIACGVSSVLAYLLKDKVFMMLPMNEKWVNLEYLVVRLGLPAIFVPILLKLILNPPLENSKIGIVAIFGALQAAVSDWSYDYVFSKQRGILSFLG